MKDHMEEVTLVVRKEFGVPQNAITRMTIGSGNEVYLVSLEDRDVIVRLNESDKTLRGSEKYIPLYRSKGIKVPEILASNYSKSLIPYCYQILSKIEGKDIGVVITELNQEQLTALAKEIAAIFRKFEDIPTNGKFGYVYADDINLFSSWTEYMQDMTNTIKTRGTKSAVIDKHLLSALDEITDEYSSYFDSVTSKFYFDDMSGKNVMIHNGIFQGLVDLDGAIYGDYLETVGRIKASWYGTTNGDFYTDAVMNALDLNAFQRKIVTMYAFMNRTCWQFWLS
jgi:Ser/Thr protein kinase RdoA (MazF antagonist)